MNISATLNGQAVTIVGIAVDGTEIYISYVDSSNNLTVTRSFLNRKVEDSATVIATSATIN